MERTLLKLSPENFITVALLSAAAYLGFIGAQIVHSAVKSKTGA